MMRKMPKIDSFLLSLYTLSFFLTGIPLWHRGSRSSNLHWHFVVFFLLVMRMFYRCDSWQSMFRKIILPSWKLTLFILYSIILFLYHAFEFGFTNSTVSLLYSFGAICVVYSLFRVYSMEDIEQAVIVGYLAGLVLVLANAAFQASAIIQYIRQGGGVHPNLQSFILGGQNQDSILCGMFAIFTMRKSYGMFVWLLGFVLSALLSSRAGITVNIMVMLWYLVFVRGLNVKTVMVIFPIIAVIFMAMVNSDVGTIVVNRFMHTEKDGGSGRVTLWLETIEVIKQYPLGVGCGNVVWAAEKINNSTWDVNNPHCIYLSYIAEQGVIFGTLLIVFSVSYVLGHELKRHFQSSFGTFILVYFVVGIAQATGVDTWIMICVACYFIERWQEKKGISYNGLNVQT